MCCILAVEGDILLGIEVSGLDIQRGGEWIIALNGCCGVWIESFH